MSSRSFTIAFLAVVCGLAAAFGVNQIVTRWEPPASPKTGPVVVTKVGIARGSTVAQSQLTTRQWPLELIPPGAITQIDKAKERAALVSLEAGEPVFDAKLGEKGMVGLAALVPSGMRAFTIHTPTIAAGMAGFILPDNEVDVLLTISGSGLPKSAGGALTATLLQNVKILAVNQALESGNANKAEKSNAIKSVTLLVTPDQASKLSLAQNKGALQLTLRNPDDNDAVRTGPVTLADLEFLQIPPITSPPEAKDEQISEYPVAEVVPPPIPVRPVVIHIRTMRGTTAGSVPVQLFPAGDTPLIATERR